MSLSKSEQKESREYWDFIRRTAADVKRSRELCGASNGEFFDVDAAEEERNLIGHLEAVSARISPSSSGADARGVIADYIKALRKRGREGA